MLETTDLSPRALVLTLGGDGLATSYGANCLALRGGDGTLLVDPLVAPAHARRIEEALSARGWPPVTHVVLTHHHTDHALGAGWFARSGAVCACTLACAAAMAAQHGAIVASRRADPALAELFADAAPHAPAAPFEAGWTVDLGGLTVEAHALGPAHSPGDAVVVVPAEGVLAAGDLLHRGYHFNYEEAALDGLDASLDRLASLGAARLVPGHGEPGDAALIGEQRAYHRAARRLVAGALTAGAAHAALLAVYPDHRLRGSVPSAVARLRPGP